MIDRILEGKRRKMLGLNTKKRKRKTEKLDESSESEDTSIDRDTLLKNELSKTVSVPPTAILVQTCTGEICSRLALDRDNIVSMLRYALVIFKNICVNKKIDLINN